MTDGRRCKFCGETGHNIRSCKSAASARNLISKFSEIVKSEVPAVAGKLFPLSGFEGNLISMNFKIKDPSLHQTERFNFLDGISYHRRTSINYAIDNVLKEAGSGNVFSDRCAISAMLEPAFEFETNNLQLGFFIESDSFVTSWSKQAEMSLIADGIDFKISDYIQGKLHEPGGNRYKTLWRKICEHANLTEKYRGWEGKEGEMIRAFLQETIEGLQKSAENKRTDPNKMFSVISSRLGRTQKSTAAESRCGVSGEWMNIEPPQFSFTWREKPEGTNLSFELTDKLKKKLEEAVKQPFLDALFIEAKNHILDVISPNRYYTKHDETAMSLGTLYRLVNERSFDFSTEAPYDQSYFQSLEVDDDFIFNEEPPPVVVSEWEKVCKTGALSAEYTVKDFIKMGHSGGYYNQMFDKGLMVTNRFPGLRPEVNIEEKNDYDGKWYNCRWIGREYRLGAASEKFSLSEIVLASLEALVYSEREVK